MMKTRLTAAAALAGAALLASASSAFAYGEPDLNISNPGVVAPGATFTLTGNYGGAECNPGVATFSGQTQDATGSSFSITFTAPDKPGTYAGSIACTYDNTADTPQASSIAPGGALVVQPAAFRSAVQGLPFSVQVGTPGSDGGSGTGSSDDAGKDSNGVIPNTGGPDGQLLLIGAGLVAVGAVVTVADRRRRQA